MSSGSFQDSPDFTAAETAALGTIPETYTIPDETLAIWEKLDAFDELPLTRGAVDALQRSMDKLCEGLVAQTTLSTAMMRNSDEEAVAAFARVAACAVDAQNALRRFIVLVASGREMARLRKAHR